MTELETRSVELRAADTEKREVEGLAVPWGELADIAGIYREQFERGALEPHTAGVKLFDAHRQIVGTVEQRDTDAGLEIIGRVAKTRAGDDFLELVRSGAYGHLSIGFEPREQLIQDEPEDGGTPIVTRTRAVLGEVSGVPWPAYAGATIAQVRSSSRPAPGDSQEEEDMTQTTVSPEKLEQLESEVRGELQELGRRMDTLGTGAGGAGAPARSRFRSGGEFLKALAAGDEEARAELRSFDFRDAGVAPATSAIAGADMGGPGWLARPLRLVQEKRRIVNLFSRETLPAQGNTVEWPKVKTTSGTVEQQANEGDALAYMELELENGTATVGTYGGYSELTRQAIERGNPAYLSTVLLYQAIQYAKNTNAAARAAFQAITPGATVGGGTITLTSATAADWIDIVVDGAAAVEDSSLGLEAEFMVVSRDVFKAIAHLVDASERPIFALPNGGQAVNVAGSADPVQAKFNIAGLPGFVDPGLPAGFARISAGEAMTTLESPGAPFRLEDDDVVNLTRAFSLYGYAAWTENDRMAVVGIDLDGV